MSDPGGEVGGPLKLHAGVHRECRGPSCLGGVACARGSQIEISPFSAWETHTSWEQLLRLDSCARFLSILSRLSTVCLLIFMP